VVNVVLMCVGVDCFGKCCFDAHVWCVGGGLCGWGVMVRCCVVGVLCICGCGAVVSCSVLLVLHFVSLQFYCFVLVFRGWWYGGGRVFVVLGI